MKRKLKIVLADERRFEGTPTEIVEQMKYRAWGWEDKPLGEYIDWAAEQLKSQFGVEIDTSGGTDEAKAERFVEQLIERGLAREVK